MMGMRLAEAPGSGAAQAAFSEHADTVGTSEIGGAAHPLGPLDLGDLFGRPNLDPVTTKFSCEGRTMSVTICC